MDARARLARGLDRGTGRVRGLSRSCRLAAGVICGDTLVLERRRVRTLRLRQVSGKYKPCPRSPNSPFCARQWRSSQFPVGDFQSQVFISFRACNRETEMPHLLLKSRSWQHLIQRGLATIWRRRLEADPRHPPSACRSKSQWPDEQVGVRIRDVRGSGPFGMPQDNLSQHRPQLREAWAE